jgi:hypothetical protein
MSLRIWGQKDESQGGQAVKYRKIPVVIEATQWMRHGDHPMVETISPDSLNGWIQTLEGGHIVCPGDYIITGVNGEHYPCKPDIFWRTYELVEEAKL